MQNEILITAFDFYPQLGGIATYTHNTAKALSEMGPHRVKVLARGTQQEFDHQQNYEIVRQELPRRAMIATKVWPSLIEQHVHEKTILLHPLWYPSAASALKIPNTIPQYICAHGQEVLAEQDTWIKRLRVQLLQSTKRSCFLNAQAIFTVSEYTRGRLIEQFPDLASKSFVTSNGIDMDRFPLPVVKAPSAKLRLLSVCRLMPHKNIDLVLRALSLLKEKEVSFEYRVVGQGPQLSPLKRLCKELQLQEHVRFVGALDQERLTEHYQWADLFLLLTKKQHQYVEGFGLVFLEAAACGTPSIGAPTGGIPEVIHHNETGWLVHEQDEKALSELLMHLHKQPQDREKVAQKSYERAISMSWERTARAMYEHF